MRGLLTILMAVLIISQAVCFPARKAVERSALFGGVASHPSAFDPDFGNVTVGSMPSRNPFDIEDAMLQ